MNLQNIEDIKSLQQYLHIMFDTPHGKEVMDFLEKACGWYESVFDPVDRDMVLINAGKREVVATLKSLLKLPAEDVMGWLKAKE